MNLEMNTAKLKKINYIFSLSLIFIIILGAFFSNLNFVSIVNAKDNLPAQLKETEERLKELRRRQEELNKNIQRESQNQASLANQTKNLDDAIRQNELQIQALQLELKKLELEVGILNDELQKIEERLVEVQERLEKIQAGLKASINLLYKMSLTRPTVLSGEATFQQTTIDQEKERSTVKLIKEDLLEIKKLEEEVKAKKAEIEEKKNKADELKAKTEAKNENLSNQQSALKWQRENRQNLLSRSFANQENLREQRANNEQRLREIENERARILAALTNLPPSNTLVDAGQVIGFQGRTGLSCELYNPQLAPTRTNDYCQRFAKLPSSYYYYDPVQFPSFGSHLHFTYSIGGQYVNAEPYVFPNGSKRSEFTVMPMSSYVITQGNHGGAVDMASSHGAPVMAVKRGFIRYHCSNWPNVPGFPDPLFGAVIHHVDANGNLDGTVSGYWHLQRRGYPC
jgi:hypothetical protein